MSIPLQIVVLEDHPADAELIIYELSRAGYKPNWQRVETEVDYLAQLNLRPDLVLADYFLPQFNAPQALRLLQERGLDIPFIVVSGMIDEDLAVSIIKQGATDYILKDRLARLGPAVKQALEQKRLRNEKQRVEAALRESEERFRSLVEGVKDYAILMLDPKGYIVSWNPGAEHIQGYQADEILGQHFSCFYPSEEVREGKPAYALRVAADKGRYEEEGWLVRKDGSKFLANTVITALRDEKGFLRGFSKVTCDITERKRAEEALRDSEERYRLLFESNPNPMWVYDIETLSFLAVNEAAIRHYGYSQEEFRSMTLQDLRPLENIPLLLERLKTLGDNQITLWRHRKKDGTIIEVETISRSLMFAGRPARLVLVNDITQRKQVEEALKKANTRLNYLLNYSPTVIYSLQIEPASSRGPFPITFVSENIRALLGYETAECLTDPNWWINHIHPEDQPHVLARQATVFYHDFLDYEYRFQHKDGTYRWIHDKIRVVYNAAGRPIDLVGSWMDITERKQAEEIVRYLAYYDALTGLPNRMLFNDRLTLAIAHARRNKQKLAIMFLDLDRFKTINDTLGYAVGDRLLQGVAERLKNYLRGEDTLARLGSDRFMLLLPGIIQVEDVAKIAQKLLEAFKRPFHFGDHELYVAASIGITLYPNDGEDIQTLMKNADTALYRAKEQGRDTYQFYTPSMNATALERLKLENSLRRALEREEFVIYYQPQVSLSTGEIVGVEALVRWQHPDLGMVPPMQFIPLAEETGLIVPLGLWVLREACAQNKAWQKSGLPALCMAVNISARLFKQPDLVETIARILKETQLDPNYLELELTEGTIMENAEAAIKTLHQLKEMGVHLSIDDFGTGYSSLSYLKRFPIDTLKIDRSFVWDITTDPDDAAITVLIINMAHNLGLKVVAEGVETKEQLEFLRSHHCDLFQGYLFSQPISAEAFIKLLQEERRLPLPGSGKVLNP